MSAISKAIKKAAKPYAQDIAEKISILHIYWDILKPQLEDNADTKNVDNAIWRLHDELAKGAVECLGLKLHDEPTDSDVGIFSGGTNKSPPPPPPGGG